MQLILIRHGIAIERDDAACPDEPDRYLTEEGVSRTHDAMAGLRALGVKPGLVYSSPFVRAAQTARIACEVLGFDPKKIVTTDALLPSGEPSDIFRELAQFEDETVACCGHAPNLDEVIAYAVGARSTFTSLKKAGAACVEFDSIRAGAGELLWLYPVGTLRRLK